VGFEAGGASPNVFEMFRDFSRESRATSGRTEDPTSKKMKTLADLFRPPVDLIEPGSFEHVKNAAQQRKKWLLVNIQEVSIFDCQRMNRDTWSDAGVKAVVGSNFVLWQVLKPSEDGLRYCRFYPVEVLPHLAIIDSLTGARLEVSEGFIEPVPLIAFLEKFLATHSLEYTKPAARAKPESPRKLGDLSEEAQLAAAIAASIERNNNLNTASEAPPPPVTTTTTTTDTIAQHEQQTTTSTPATAPPTAPQPEEPKKEPEPAQAPRPTHLLAEHANPSAECTCTIQVRMPAGPIKGHFKPNDTLRTVHQYVGLHLDPPSEFKLVSSFPKKVFSELDTTMQQADLVPRAVLICELS